MSFQTPSRPDGREGALEMHVPRKRRAAIAAALTTPMIAVPAGSAHAAAVPTVPPDIATGWADTLAGQAVAVIGPTIITTAPTTFINTNNQVTAGSTASGGQLAGTTTGIG
jgi:hypothetical protein